jgi:hypothetical protein
MGARSVQKRRRRPWKIVAREPALDNPDTPDTAITKLRGLGLSSVLGELNRIAVSLGWVGSGLDRFGLVGFGRGCRQVRTGGGGIEGMARQLCKSSQESEYTY